MSKPVVTIELERGPWPGDAYEHAWPVGRCVTGRVRIDASVATKTRRITACLEWKTEGRGNRNTGTASRVTIHEGDLYEGMSIRYEFELRIPEDGPISYEGHLIRILWAVMVRIDIPWGRDVVERAAITVVPDYDEARTRRV